MNMYSWSLLILVMAVAVLVGMGSLIKPEPAPRVRVYTVRPRWPVEPLEPFPGDGVVTHNELDQFARHYQGLTR